MITNWILVSNKLPENFNDVLVLHYVSDIWPMPLVCRYYENLDKWYFMDKPFKGNIKYWMPIQSPPNEKDNPTISVKVEDIKRALRPPQFPDDRAV